MPYIVVLAAGHVPGRPGLKSILACHTKLDDLSDDSSKTKVIWQDKKISPFSKARSRKHHFTSNNEVYI